MQCLMPYADLRYFQYGVTWHIKNQLMPKEAGTLPGTEYSNVVALLGTLAFS